MKNTLRFYKFVSWLYPLLKLLLPGSASTWKELGLAMIHLTLKGCPKNLLEGKDIVALAKENKK
jgi:hypothetical protein